MLVDSLAKETEVTEKLGEDPKSSSKLLDSNVENGEDGNEEVGSEEGSDVIDQEMTRDRVRPVETLKDFLQRSRVHDSEIEGVKPRQDPVLGVGFQSEQDGDGATKGILNKTENAGKENVDDPGLPREKQSTTSRSNSLIPPPTPWEPPTTRQRVRAMLYSISSNILSFAFLMIVVLGALVKMIPEASGRFWLFITFKNYKMNRPFYQEEKQRSKARRKAEREWVESKTHKSQNSGSENSVQDVESTKREEEHADFKATEGGLDRLIPDIGYYARRAGLDCETFLVQTEDGFILELFHLYNPLTTSSTPESKRHELYSEIFQPNDDAETSPASSRQYPVLLIPGLLQSPGAYCCSGADNSIAFYLAKSGLDVWLGSNRCGFLVRHSQLKSYDPRMWSWNLRHMGALDLPALVGRVLQHTRFKTLGLVCHSQGTAEALVAFAKQQRPELGNRISIACLLAPAAYAGKLVKRPIFRVLRIVTPRMFRALFGVTEFIPFMQLMRKTLPSRLYGVLGYRVFNYLFGWSDRRWERELRDRFFLFSPTIVSAESMRWWLGREGFARAKCILQTKEQGKVEEQEYEGEDQVQSIEGRKKSAWYDERCPPLALWVPGSDDLVDGKKLLKRFSSGREPHVKVVHSKVIEDYEHLDVLWAVDVIDTVGKEILDCIWKTVPMEVRESCKVPKGCVGTDAWISQKS